MINFTSKIHLQKNKTSLEIREWWKNSETPWLMFNSQSDINN